MKKGQYLKVRSNCPLLFATTEVGQKVFRHFDPFSCFLRQKLAFFKTLAFQGSFFYSQKFKKTPNPHSHQSRWKCATDGRIYKKPKKLLKNA